MAESKHVFIKFLNLFVFDDIYTNKRKNKYFLERTEWMVNNNYNSLGHNLWNHFLLHLVGFCCTK